MPLLTLRDITLNLSGHPLLEHASLHIHAGEHLCLIGRNGVGKSTLLKLITQQLEPDSGTIERKPGLQTALLSQEVPQQLSGTVFDLVSSGLGKLGNLLQHYEALNQELQKKSTPKLLEQLQNLQEQIEFQDGWKHQTTINKIISQMGLDPNAMLSSLSGGLIRRVLTARALSTDPDILLLDEPTNHLDIEGITWLETFLKNYKKTVLFISHDRAFMQALASRFIEIDNHKVYSYPGHYHAYLKQKDAALAAQELQEAQFDKKLAQEEIWIRQGVKARRTRNEGRVRALKEMRQVRAQRITRQEKAKFSIHTPLDSGKIVFEVKKLSYAVNNTPIIANFSTLISRGDKIGIIGRNGSGKTTLLKLLLHQLKPTAGTVQHGTKLSLAYFDQYRHQLDPEKTVRENVYPGEQIPYHGKTLHVMSYLQKFLFSPQRARTKVSVLSGGERNRLLLAKLFTQPSNVLIMDEPTNDLDLETLELLEEQLIEYPGTILLVSHDRAFLNNVVTSTLVLEAQGNVEEYVGGYDDWQRQRPTSAATQPSAAELASPPIKLKAKTKLSYKEQRELDQLPDQITHLEAELEQLQTHMSTAEFYQQPQAKIVTAQQKLTALEKNLETLYQRWEFLLSL